MRTLPVLAKRKRRSQGVPPRDVDRESTRGGCSRFFGSSLAAVHTCSSQEHVG